VPTRRLPTTSPSTSRFARPEYLRREDVPAEQIEDVRQTDGAIARNEGKPAAALDKIVEGRLRAGTKSAYCSSNRSSARQFHDRAAARWCGAAQFAQAVVGS